MTLRKITLGRRFRSDTLLVYGTLRLVTNTNKPVGGDALAQFASRFADRDSRHDPIEPEIQVGLIVLQCGIFQRASPSPDGNRAQQQTLERGAEGGIATLDGVARIAQQMRRHTCQSIP